MTCHTLEEFYHIDGHTFEKQYKEVLSGFRQWEQLEHADKWLLFPENIGPCLAIDESSLSNGELYTFVTNREVRTREQSLVAVVAGTKAEDVIAVLQRIDEEHRNAVEEVTLDLSDSMRKIVRTAFPKASRVIDRFHIQKLACDAVQELRIKHRWDAMQQANDEMEEARQPFPFNLRQVDRQAKAKGLITFKIPGTSKRHTDCHFLRRSLQHNNPFHGTLVQQSRRSGIPLL